MIEIVFHQKFEAFFDFGLFSHYLFASQSIRQVCLNAEFSISRELFVR